MRVLVPIRTARGGNNREHPMVRHRRVVAERYATGIFLNVARRPALPLTCTLTRHAPSNGLDDDNLRGALKAVRDQVAQWLGIDDRDPRCAWRYAQQRTSKWGVLIEFEEGQRNGKT